ncbi:hypothetical protein AruPA_15560 [Acidiphilium sp. PA]|uniref:hypothetical protein n=1 Tax=Acidiphilium sp. PA TaxID=2871705 RepID=UPI002244B2CB|nr:hypothetical protein [Acidiphilium sp. PA]MCW8308456.1 hypothetical protein [Acidiphilium sp. PA]
MKLSPFSIDVDSLQYGQSSGRSSRGQGVVVRRWSRSTARRQVFFFVNKKEAKKTSLIYARAGKTARAPESESFLLLFFKKEVLSLICLSSREATANV